MDMIKVREFAERHAARSPVRCLSLHTESRSCDRKFAAKNACAFSGVSAACSELSQATRPHACLTASRNLCDCSDYTKLKHLGQSMPCLLLRLRLTIHDNRSSSFVRAHLFLLPAQSPSEETRCPGRCPSSPNPASGPPTPNPVSHAPNLQHNPLIQSIMTFTIASLSIS